ncbi:MAG TPA: hypothetical protein VGL62_02630, partial [Vicinamibacterales bacterium]
IRPFGINGVAWGTLIPVAIASLFVLWPAACTRVGLSMTYCARKAVWPTVWPGLIVAGVLALTRTAFPVSYLGLAAQAGIAGIVYLALFSVALGRADRALYSAKLMELIGWRGFAPVP